MITPQEQMLMNRELYRMLFGIGKKELRLEAATMQAKQIIADPDIRKTWILLGDPTTRFK